MPLILYWFYKVTFSDTITNTCFMSSFLPCVPFSHPSCCCHQNVWHHGWNTRKLSVLCKGHWRNACRYCSHFCLHLFLSLWGELLMTCSSVLKTISPQEKVWSVGLPYRSVKSKLVTTGTISQEKIPTRTKTHQVIDLPLKKDSYPPPPPPPPNVPEVSDVVKSGSYNLHACESSVTWMLSP